MLIKLIESLIEYFFGGKSEEQINFFVLIASNLSQVSRRHASICRFIRSIKLIEIEFNLNQAHLQTLLLLCSSLLGDLENNKNKLH